jgi:hypothetical protein
MRKVATLLTVPTGALHRIAMGTHELVWMRAQVRDNLHQFDDGVYIGRLAASETLSDAPIVHTGSLPRSFDTVSSGVVIRSGPELTVEPLGVTLTFRCSDTISDRQLLLAAHDDLRPSAAGVAVLASIGHFPGDMTLFDEVRRIPLLERWYVTTRRGERTRALSLPKANDDLMIDRLVSLIPTDVPHALGLSGGNDSRFMLGILLRAKADVRLVRFTDFESATALGIADQLGLEVQGIGAPAEQDGQRSWYEFMLLTDAQIWHSVTQHGRLGQNLTAADMFHSGHFSPSMTKNTFKTAWKVPDPRRPFWDRLVHSAFLSNAPAVQPALRAVSRREELEQVVRDELQSQRTYVEFTTRKQWANWLYFANRGVRWSQAFYGDLDEPGLLAERYRCTAARDLDGVLGQLPQRPCRSPEPSAAARGRRPVPQRTSRGRHDGSSGRMGQAGVRVPRAIPDSSVSPGDARCQHLHLPRGSAGRSAAWVRPPVRPPDG